MSVIAWIVLGLASGFIGSRLVNRRGMGVVLDVALGAVGAVLGGLAVTSCSASGVTELNLWSAAVAVLGAIAVLFGYRVVREML